MRDVEQRLGKPDPSEDTQAKQKQIVKRIETMIEQVRQSGSSAGRLTMRRRQQQGNQPGQQQGDQTGALAQGVGPHEAGQADQPALDGRGQGHLGAPAGRSCARSWRTASRRSALDSKSELISRYFLSVGKGKLVREE